MLTRRLGGAAAALLLGLTVSARAGDDAAAPSSGGRWWDRLNPFGSKKSDDSQIPPTVPVPGNTPAAAGVPATVPAAALPGGPAETELQAYWRRTRVCDRLSQIGLDTGNTELQEQAYQLQQRVFEVYRQRIGGAPRFESDEATLNQRLGTGDGGRPMAPTERTRSDGRTTNLREDRE